VAREPLAGTAGEITLDRSGGAALAALRGCVFAHPFGSDTRPLLVVLDDYHPAAPSTGQLVSHLSRSASPNVVVLATLRPEEHREHNEDALGSGRSGSTPEVLEVGGLSTTDAAEMVAIHSGDTPPVELSDHLRRLTNGNPFFLGAMLTHLDDVGSVRSTSGGWISAAELDAAGVPTGIRGVVGSRLAQLDERGAAPRACSMRSATLRTGSACSDWTPRRELFSRRLPAEMPQPARREPATVRTHRRAVTAIARPCRSVRSGEVREPAFGSGIRHHDARPASVVRRVDAAFAPSSIAQPRWTVAHRSTSGSLYPP
jgi:hypothetical protein